MSSPNLIFNSQLTLAQVPDLDVRSLDTNGWLDDESQGGRWKTLWEFALTFNGWKYFGDDDNVVPRLAAFDESIRAAFDQTGHLPTIDLALLRACLFYEQRLLCKYSMRGPDDQRKSYLQALLDAIRAAIS